MVSAMGAELFLAFFSAVVLLPALALVVWGAVLDGRGNEQQPTPVPVAEERDRTSRAARKRGDL